MISVVLYKEKRHSVPIEMMRFLVKNMSIMAGGTG